jgi:hypothetical protein
VEGLRRNFGTPILQLEYEVEEEQQEEISKKGVHSRQISVFVVSCVLV